MEARELLEKINVFPIIAGGLAEELLSGNFSSIFKGQGIEFDEVRHYERGDDIRSIDWNASARFGYPFVKMYREERDLTIMLLLDTSASMRRESFRVQENSKKESLSPYEQGLLAAALIAFSAERTNQRVGAILFDRGLERVFAPRKGRRHIMAFVGGALKYQRRYLQIKENRNAGSNLRAALSGAGRMLRRRSLVVVISDFMCANWEQEMENLCCKHDVLALRITDPADTNLPDWGLAAMEDPETGVKIKALTAFPTFKEAWTLWRQERAEQWEDGCKRSGAAHLELPTNADPVLSLQRYFSVAHNVWHSRHTARRHHARQTGEGAEQ